MSGLGQYLIAEGVPTSDHPVPGRPTSVSWDRPRFIVVHHFVGSEDPGDIGRQVDFLKTGKQYPPNSQLYVDVLGMTHVICEERAGQKEPGRATHMGGGSYPDIPKDRGNEVCVGIECQNTGYHPLRDQKVLYQALIRLIAALCKRYGLTHHEVIGHKEYNPGKVDPRDDMDVIRADVKRALEGNSDTDRDKPERKPVVSLAAVRDSAVKDPPAPGGTFTNKDDVLVVERALRSEGLLDSQYVDGHFGTKTISAYSEWQQRLGYTGKDADGVPGKTSLTRLGGKYGFAVKDDAKPAPPPPKPKPKPSKPTVSLAAVVNSSHVDPPAPSGTYTNKNDVLLVERALMREGLLNQQYVDGHFGTMTVSGYAAWQRRCGYRGKDADGHPGRDSLTRLGKKHGFNVTA